MCVIIIKQKGKDVPSNVLKSSARMNPHGLGVVWLDAFNVSYHDSKDYKVLETNRPYIAHFRYATIGKICKENTHPFECGVNKDELFMMNGTAEGYGNENMTDTEALAIELGNKPRSTWKKELAKFDARFVAINRARRTFQIFNKHLFTHRDGVWYSKANVLQDNVVAVYGTLKRGFGNYYSYLTRSTFLGSGQTKHKYPLVVSGLPYLIEKKGQGHNVAVDVFKVDDDTFRRLDMLEGHPKWYIRKQIPIMINRREVMAWIYFNPTENGIWNGKNHVKSYEGGRSVSYWDLPEPKSTPTCTQLDWFDEFEAKIDDHDDICIDCFNDLEFDGFSNYHCKGCDSWFTEDEVVRSRFQ